LKSPVVERIEFTIYLLSCFFIRLFPRRLLLRLGSGVGRQFYRLDRRHRELARRNLRETLGSDEIAVHVFEHFGRMTLDTIRLSNLDRQGILDVVDVVGREHMDEALARGRGVILFTAHYGNWEIGALATALLFGPLLVIVRALDNRLLERRLQVRRQRHGNHVVEKREAARPVLRALASGGIVAILVDQRVHPSEGLPTTFLGRACRTTPAAARMALQTGAALIPGWCEPVSPDGLRYRVVYRPPVPTRLGDAERPASDIVQECNDVLGGMIRQRPEVWLWVHDRWKGGAGESDSSADAESRASGERMP